MRSGVDPQQSKVDLINAGKTPIIEKDIGEIIAEQVEAGRLVATTDDGWHDGYASLPDPVTHRRRIDLEKATRRIVIRDTLEMRGEHDIELFFHCHEECEVRQEGSRLRIARGRDAVTLSLPEGGQVRVLRGSMAPIGGWVSRAFDRKQPAPTILWRARLSGNAVLRSEIACG